MAADAAQNWRRNENAKGGLRMIRLTGRVMPRWLGVVMHAVLQPASHSGVPWLLSRAGLRHGWAEGFPGTFNLAGIPLVVAGFAVIFWCLQEPCSQAPRGWRLERTPHYPTPDYLITSGPYRYSRNPIYLAEAAIWLGWILFYGGLAVAVCLALFTLAGPFIRRQEERGLEARFGETWHAYKRSTPAWLGIRRSGQE
jgi:protein-S-isoprenylcysteine O-methyltransferase Ste14